MFWSHAAPEATGGQSDAGPGGVAPEKRAQIGIALGAGAARGWSHIGVVRTLVEAGIAPDVIAGTSIGALVAGCYAAGKLDALEDFARGLTRRRIFSLLDFSWRGSGLITGDKLHDLLDSQFGDTLFEQLQRPFICIATELMTGHEIWLRSGRVGEAIRASYALPGVFKPVRVGQQWLIDGAVVNPIPVSACRAMGARLVIAVNLTNDAFGGTVIQTPRPLFDGGTAAPPAPADAERGRMTQLRQMVGRTDDPGITTVLVAAFNISQDRLARSRLAGDPPDISIAPRATSIGLFDFDKAEEAIQAGREATRRALLDIEHTIRMLERAVSG